MDTPDSHPKEQTEHTAAASPDKKILVIVFCVPGHAGQGCATKVTQWALGKVG